MNFWDTILSAIFPARCAGCGRADFELCPECLALCPRAERESQSWIFPLYDYRHPLVKKALHLFKYKNRRNLAGVFAEALYGHMQEELADLLVLENFQSPLLVPVPLSRRRLRERGYNQCELICREIIKLADARAGGHLSLETEMLFKPRDTEHQARIRDRRQRMENMRGTFRAKEGAGVAGRNIILVDDILTTGATLSDAKRALRAAGARKVVAFAVAH